MISDLYAIRHCRFIGLVYFAFPQLLQAQSDEYSLTFLATGSDLQDTTYYQCNINQDGALGLDSGDLLDTIPNQDFRFRGLDTSINHTLSLSSCGNLFRESQGFAANRNDFLVNGISNTPSFTNNPFGSGNLYLFWDSALIDHSYYDSIEIDYVFLHAKSGFIGFQGNKYYSLFDKNLPLPYQKESPPISVFNDSIWDCQGLDYGFSINIIIGYSKLFQSINTRSNDSLRIFMSDNSFFHVKNTSNQEYDLEVFTTKGKSILHKRIIPNSTLKTYLHNREKFLIVRYSNKSSLYHLKIHSK